MHADVFYNGNSVGTIEWTPDSRGVQVALDCALCGSELLRCYAECGAHTLRVGLPAPEHRRLRLHRRLSLETLRASGCTGVPERFYLAVEPEDAPPALPLTTGDAVLDALLADGEVTIEQTETGMCLRCPFDPQKPFALAPAFVLCRVESGAAVLTWKKDAADTAASSEKA